MRACSIPGCDRPFYARGWCNAHHRRVLRHGDPLAGRTPEGEPAHFYREVVLTDERGPDDPCLVWPYAENGMGYGVMSVDGHMRLVSRLACEERHGPPPTPKHEAAHSCGKGHLRCCTKGHLDWKTHKENIADELLRGTRQRGERQGSSRLKEPEIREILALKGQMTQQAIADRFGVGRPYVSLLHSRKRWGWLS